MTLLSPARYRVLSGDDTSEAVVTARIAEAHELLVDALGRPLELQTRTERMYLDAGGWAWPQATPIKAAPGYTIDGYGIVGPLPRGTSNILLDHLTNYVDISYTGGWVASDDEDDVAHRVPTAIELDLAGCVQWLIAGAARRRTMADLPAGAQSVRVGDVAVTYGKGGAAGANSYPWSPGTLRYRYRRA